ncbi:MAG: hypothetical protein WAK33_04635 [Silvibacterium sp.]
MATTPVTTPSTSQVGNELQEVQFGELIRSIAQGIADGQQALDMSAVQTLVALSNTYIDVIPEISEVITPQPINVPISGHPSIEVTGARVTATASDPVQMTAIQAGLLPTFYQFTEVDIALKISVQLRQVTTTETDGTQSVGIFAFGSHVNFRNQNTYSYSVDASSSVTATLKPVPANLRLTPTVITVNALSKTPTVSISS